MSIRLVLVRHGQSEWNVEGRVQGQDGSGLSDLGAEQAERVAAAVAAAYPDALLVASDLERCTETAAPFQDRMDRAAVQDEGLRERHFGAWSGSLLSEIAEGWPELWQRWRGGEDVVAEVGGESTESLRDRIVGTYRRIAAEVGDGGVAVCVTHGGPVWHGAHALVGLPHGSLGPVGNASITTVALDGETRATLEGWNEVGHLPPPLRSTLRPSGHALRTAPPVGR